jgi:uncharacterized membrane protein SirB2
VIEYSTVRAVHIGSAALSITLFVARAGMQWARWNWRQWRWLRVLPHLTDTVLLAAAITLVWMSHQYPWQQAWLAAKLVAVFAYVALGTVALRQGATKASQRAAIVGALFTAAYIVGIALTRCATLGLGMSCG